MIAEDQVEKVCGQIGMLLNEFKGPGRNVPMTEEELWAIRDTLLWMLGNDGTRFEMFAGWIGVSRDQK